MTKRRRVMLAACGLVVLAGAGVGTPAALGAFSGPTAQQLAQARQEAAARKAAAAQAAQQAKDARLFAEETRLADRAASALSVSLPRTLGAAAPTVPAQLFKAPEAPHQVVGYAPYWLAGGLTQADFTDVSVVAWYGLDVTAAGTLQQSGPAWTDFSSPGFATFVASAHAAGDRVLLTVDLSTPGAIAKLLKAPATTGARLAGQLLPLVAADKLDGVDVDIEGRSSKLREPFVRFVAALRAAMRTGDASGELVVNTYPQSAGSRTDFFDVRRLAAEADQLFVMGYDMYDPRVASANAPLASPTLGLSDVQSLLAYVKEVPRSKLVLGVPYYGYDFTTRSLAHGARATAPSPSARYFSAILAVGRKAFWDPGTSTVYTRFRYQGHFHQTWYDDPVSIALKTALASQFHLAGVGVWALGMEGADTSMLLALGGGSAPVKLSIASP